MTKTIRAVFDGKAFVPHDANNVPMGAEVTFDIEVPPPDEDTRTAGERLRDAVAGSITWEEGEAWLQQVYADRRTSMDDPDRTLE
ncbi:MAG TPA: hypothetical protein VF595_18325 [Tepidisphaeraceae bacterium]|jgi:hypothetical protein